ncbi:hypothetical protein [Asaia bogorensis]|uniref:hypothetical protein n=1 Tax=Asaia bogorensis TaxID=91915 RepID=UPI003015B86A
MGLTDMPKTKNGVAINLRSRGMHRRELEGQMWRKRRGAGGGREFRYTALPLAARNDWIERFEYTSADENQDETIRILARALLEEISLGHRPKIAAVKRLHALLSGFIIAAQGSFKSAAPGEDGGDADA